MTGKTRIVLVDDHPIVLTGLHNLISSNSDMEIVGEAAEGLDALRLIRETRPDVAIVDISMPKLNGVALTSRLREECPSVRVLLLTFQEERAYINQAMQAGARGYVVKRAAAEHLIQAIRAVAVGGLYLDPTVAEQIGILERARNTGTTAEGDLSEREVEVLKMVALGFSMKEIGIKLDVSVKSAETYKLRGSKKIGFKTRAEIVRYAALQGWLADS